VLNIFKSKKKADSIFHNGKIYCGYDFSNIEEALAIKDERIIAIGDFEAMEELMDDETELFDLEGKFVFPGFINTDTDYVNEVFFEQYIHLDEDMEVQEIMDAIEGMSYYYEEKEVIFAQGYGDDVFSDLSAMEVTKMLDLISNEKPVLLVANNNMECVYNSYAKDLILGTAEEEVVEIITLPYILNLLIPYDFDQVMEKVMRVNEEASEKGFTTVFNSKSPYYFDEVFENALLELYNEGDLRFKYQGSFYANRAFNLKYIKYILGKLRTNCSELSNYIEHDSMFIEMNNRMSSTWLAEVINYCDEINVNLQINCKNEKDMEKLEEVLIKSKGNERLNVVAVCDTDMNSEFVDVYPSGKTTFKDTEAWIKYNTEEAAERLGMQEVIGIIDEGYVADMAIFAENPMEMRLSEFKKLNASITVVNGKIVYDEDRERDDEWYDIFSGAPL